MQIHNIRVLILSCVVAAAMTSCDDRGASDKVGESLDHAMHTDELTRSPKDAVITTKVKEAILVEPSLSTFDIKVDTIDGVTTLDGQVDSQANFETAEKITATVSGVQKVRNQLFVKGTN